MEYQILVSLSYFLRNISAGGYQGCLERVHLFQAYEIEGLLPATDHQLGKRCVDWDDRRGHKNCRGDNYEACAGSRPGGRCTYDELQDFMRPARENAPWVGTGVYQTNGKIALEATAVNCYNRYIGRRMPNFPAYSLNKSKAMTGNVYEYNDYLKKLGNRVDYVFRQQTDDTNRHLFDDFDNTRNEINRVRAGDHGIHLVPAARASDVNNIVVQDLGINRATGERMETVDWAKTANQARANGDHDVTNRIQTFNKNFYHTPGDDESRRARQHLQVFRSYKYIEDRARSCGRRT